MNIFQFVKSQITTRQAAEHYGLNVQRNGMTLCPFHDDHAPSLKVDTRFYCFGCQVKGDVIDFVSKLFGLSLIRAAQKLTADFGLDPNTPQSAAVVPAQPPVVQQRRLVLECTKALTDYERLLNHWKTAYAPADMNAPWDGRFAQSPLHAKTTPTLPKRCAANWKVSSFGRSRACSVLSAISFDFRRANVLKATAMWSSRMQTTSSSLWNQLNMSN